MGGDDAIIPMDPAMTGNLLETEGQRAADERAYDLELERIEGEEELTEDVREEEKLQARIARRGVGEKVLTAGQAAQVSEAKTGMAYSAPAARKTEALQVGAGRTYEDIARGETKSKGDYKDKLALLETERETAESTWKDQQVAHAGTLGDIYTTAGDQLGKVRERLATLFQTHLNYGYSLPGGAMADKFENTPFGGSFTEDYGDIPESKTHQERIESSEKFITALQNAAQNMAVTIAEGGNV
jgi:hypothetical protein